MKEKDRFSKYVLFVVLIVLLFAIIALINAPKKHFYGYAPKQVQASISNWDRIKIILQPLQKP